MAVIELQDISKHYGSGEFSTEVLSDVNLSISLGEYCAIMGPSGSGKSTMMNIIGCLDRPTNGQYFFDGYQVERLSRSQLAYLRNHNIGFVFQQFHLLPQLSTLENVMLPMTYAGIEKNQRQERAELALEQMELGHRFNYKPTELSGGQQQRVAIARAIVNQPSLLLADEPTGALDSWTSKSILNVFRDLNKQGMTVVVVTHDPEVGDQCDRIIYFKDGRVLE